MTTPRWKTEPAEQGAPRRRRHLLVALGAVLVLGGAGGTVYTLSERGHTDVDGGEAASLSAEGLVACASAVAEGRVAQAGPAGAGSGFRVVLRVDRAYKPAGGETRRLEFLTPEPDAERYYRVGARMLVLVPSHQGEAPSAYRDGDASPEGTGDALEWARAWVKKAIPESGRMKCAENGGAD
ncbi:MULTISPECIES: hypothetical protein [Streptomyces]|uniref:Tat pathway signal sequence domain protein n=1 Tax=Streptomyces canarius TaxID=285453 RepID=A0ABQ3CJG1_9ACTN|nr:hypothetical protein [Streptomyces canarius]GHA20798.1 hypothetical protein GCM10010345_27350 [Streptomyces canarius]